ncbi:MAG: MBL fold metallo-hydrolase [Candidatus Methanomethylicota archaeon]|uniref:MBL fold metallo-hydrolase n=1 Tax=Thermoproteota archaeon TaxID=2056631 RepID=A0A497EYA1_9CREN|nr:MAG: MBL fold metallo-hydrolase [Candidatus Verstraetearchaeota archaeon]RLE52363.1 MAG: MBL fold metallo-hydrolase [Candidatus Verstraetearchaeota archaeon]
MMLADEVQNVELKVLVENTAGARRILGAHGLSIHVRAELSDGKQVNILFDTGPSPMVLRDNAEVMGLNFNYLDAIVLSHGHYDHTGGLIEALKLTSKKTPVVAHPHCFNPKFAVDPKIRYNGIPFTQNEVMKYGNLILAKNPVKLSPGILTTGEVPRITDFEKVGKMKTIINGAVVDDKMLDDQALIVNLNGELIVIAGCAHAGIINTIMRAMELTNIRKVRAVIGGFHLIGASEHRIEKTIKYLEKFGVENIMPCHCTGEKAMLKMAIKFKEKFRRIAAGQTLKFS